jgi:hypothetical protein
VTVRAGHTPLVMNGLRLTGKMCGPAALDFDESAEQGWRMVDTQTALVELRYLLYLEPSNARLPLALPDMRPASLASHKIVVAVPGDYLARSRSMSAARVERVEHLPQLRHYGYQVPLRGGDRDDYRAALKAAHEVYPVPRAALVIRGVAEELAILTPTAVDRRLLVPVHPTAVRAYPAAQLTDRCFG